MFSDGGLLQCSGAAGPTPALFDPRGVRRADRDLRQRPGRLHTDDPATNPDADLIPNITAGELRDRGLPELPPEPVVVEMLVNARLVQRVQLINGLTAGTMVRAVRGEPVGTVITVG